MMVMTNYLQMDRFVRRAAEQVSPANHLSVGLPRDGSEWCHSFVCGAGWRVVALVAAVERDVAGAIGPAVGVEDSVCGEGIELGLDIRGQLGAADAGSA